MRAANSKIASMSPRLSVQSPTSSHDMDDRRNGSVLVVDDSYADFDDLRRSLSRSEVFKFDVHRASTVEEAREARLNNEFDVLLIDFNLGIDSGARYLSEIGGRGAKGIPIVVTGLVDNRVRLLALEAGAIGVIDKSEISPRVLDATILSGMQTREVENRLHSIISAMSTVAANGASAADLHAHTKRSEQADVTEK